MAWRIDSSGFRIIVNDNDYLTAARNTSYNRTYCYAQTASTKSQPLPCYAPLQLKKTETYTISASKPKTIQQAIRRRLLKHRFRRRLAKAELLLRRRLRARQIVDHETASPPEKLARIGCFVLVVRRRGFPGLDMKFPIPYWTKKVS